MPQTRGSYGFEIGSSGTLVDNVTNLEKLRRLFRDGQIIGDDWGPGNPGDFDHGAWHILCHLAAGSGVLQYPHGRAWCGITHVPQDDTYQATVIYRQRGTPRTDPLHAAEGATAVQEASRLGFIEGSSLGHIAARGVRDTRSAFNGWPRQMFDREASSSDDGGTVWEHWSTTRDIRTSGAIGTSVLRAWLTLVATLGGRFIAAVARGRREHSHPKHLVALVRAGVLSEDEATWDVTPDPIPRSAQELLLEAQPAAYLAAVELLPLSTDFQRYYMFDRRIDRWSSASMVKSDLSALTIEGPNEA